jgi:hypothetical protein
MRLGCLLRGLAIVGLLVLATCMQFAMGIPR